jgi:hypothetical protein
MYLARSGLPPEKKDGHVAAWKSACGRMAGDLESVELPWTLWPSFSLSGRASNLSRTMWLNMRTIEPPVLGKLSVSRGLDFFGIIYYMFLRASTISGYCSVSIS